MRRASRGGTSRLGRLRRALFVYQNGKCHFCSRICMLNVQNHPLLFTIEHIIPAFVGGKNNLENLVGVCEPCNQQRNHEMYIGLNNHREWLWSKVKEAREINKNRDLDEIELVARFGRNVFGLGKLTYGSEYKG